MTTIRRNWTKRVEGIRAAARFCRAYDSSTGHMITVDPARAFEVWEANRRASLTEDTPGRRWTVHVHSNSFYVLTAADPAEDRKLATPAPAPAPARAPLPVPDARVRAAEEDAVLRDAREYIQDAPGIGARTMAAATAAVGAKVRTGRITRDRLTGALPAITAAVTAKAVRDMRAQGLTHDEIRTRLERKRAEGLQAGNPGRVTVAEAMLAAHAGIVADEEARAAALAAGNPTEPPALPDASR